MRRYLGWFLSPGLGLLVMGGLLFAACGDDDDNDSDGGASADDNAANINDLNSDDHHIHPYTVDAFSRQYNCLIYSHKIAEEGGMWCERVTLEAATTEGDTLRCQWDDDPDEIIAGDQTLTCAGSDGQTFDVPVTRTG